MQIRFADRRPEGDYALVLPVAGKDRKTLGSIGPGEQAANAALDRQRFEGDASSTAEHFFDDSGTARRLLAVGTGADAPAAAAEKLGGSVSARLLTSGDTKAVIDLSGLGYDADSAARVALAAALRGWRYDRYRTTLKDKQKPTLTEIVIVGAAADAEHRYTSRWEPVVLGTELTRELVTEPANIIYPETFVERAKTALEGSGVEIEVLDR
ncbi:MAG TPA: M17 family peptidase N-terminal domain-containing protein, partial [Sphingomicrobium sp.]